MNRRLAPLVRVMREAAAGDAETAVTLAALNAERLDGMSEFAALLDARGALRSGVSRREAADALWTLNSPELYELLSERSDRAPRLHLFRSAETSGHRNGHSDAGVVGPSKHRSGRSRPRSLDREGVTQSNCLVRNAQLVRGRGTC
ncbi:MAG: hypothetical protein JOY58_03945 [Solirubrobacterales bacterium]|nr:hypothetical protein [Solirubrobacterales bacterium]MBV9047394.1 hypothetical protein [Solirubrobacterales bacterium]